MRWIFYRIGQFHRALNEVPTSEALARAERALEPGMFSLFIQLLPFEQAHSIRVFDQLEEQGYSQPELLTAALLHDVGKARYPLRAWQRAAGVLVQKFFPKQVKRWGQGKPRGLMLGVVVSEQHAHWGAEMAEEAGATMPVVRLIAHHQDQNLSQLSEEEQRLVKALQAVDKIS